MSSASVPHLLYHTLSTTLHPSNTPDSVLTIRFSNSVRIESIRIVPEGVSTLSGIGCTYPSQFTAKVLLNVSPSNPVNALSGTTITYDGDKGWEQDYQIGMPEGVSTRMMIVVGKIDRLSLSVYGYGPSKAEAMDDSMTSSVDEHTSSVLEKEDWSWVSKWAGGVDGLINTLASGSSMGKRKKAIECLELLSEVNAAILDRIVQLPTALINLLPLFPPPQLLHEIIDNPKHALHPKVRDLLPEGHRYKAVLEGPEAHRRDAACRLLPDEAALRVLRELGIGEWTNRDGSSGSSRLGRLLDVLEGWDGTDDGYITGLDLLLSGIGSNWSSTLARKVTPLIVNSHIRGGDHAVNIPLSYSQQVITALVLMPAFIEGKAALSIASSLAQPYLAGLRPSNPLRRAFQPTPLALSPNDTPIDRELSRFSESLHSPQNGYTHSLTPSQLLSVLAPELSHALSTARQPPFGLASVIGTTQNHTSASASAYAGKVYTSHDFRSRQAVAEQISGVTAGNAGLGIGGNRGESRPASRHVDEYLK